MTTIGLSGSAQTMSPDSQRRYKIITRDLKVTKINMEDQKAKNSLKLQHEEIQFPQSR